MASAPILVCTFSGINDTVSEGGACTITLSLADMRNSKIATNQPVGVMVTPADAPADDSADALADRLGYALDLDNEGCATMCIAATWPSPTLATGFTTLSKSLYESLARPETGATVSIRTKSLEKVKVDKVYARLLYNLELERIACLPPASLPGSAAATAKRSPAKSAPKSKRKSKDDAAGSTAGTTAASTSAPQAPEPSPGSKLSPASLEWLLDTVTTSEGGSSSRAILQKLLLSHWHKRWFLNGNIAVTPLLGRRILFQVLVPQTPDELNIEVFRSQEVNYLAESESESSKGAPAPLQIFQLDAQNTELDVLPPGAAVPQQQTQTDQQATLQAAIGKATQALQDDMEMVPDGVVEAVTRCLRNGFNAQQRETFATFADLGGVEKHKAVLDTAVLLPLLQPQFYEQYGMSPPHGFLMFGPPGTGKTRLASACAAEANATFMVVNGGELTTNVKGESELSVRGVFLAAKALTPCVLFLDECDAFAPPREGMASGVAMGSSQGASGASARALGTLMHEMDALGDLVGDAARVVVIGATNRPEMLDRALRRPGRFEKEMEVGVPTPAARTAMLEQNMHPLSHNVTKEGMKRIAGTLHGFVAADIYGLAQAGAMRVMSRYVDVAEAEGEAAAEEKVDLIVTEEDLRLARQTITPSALKEVQFEVPKVSWDDIGGLEKLKKQLQDIVSNLKLDPNEEQTALSRAQPRGVLLFGPPGCSKTMLARAMATQGGLNFLHIRGTDIYSKYVGESEKAIARAFARARQSAPSILFMDEIDTVTASRDQGGGHEVYKRVLGEILSALDGIKSRSQVLFLAATNRPADLDSALLRPGRLDRLVYVPPPDTAARESILKAIMKKMAMGPDVDAAQLAGLTARFTGADLQNLCREAGLAALTESFDIPYISRRHFDDAFKLVRASPQPDEELLASYKKMQRGAQAV